MQPTQTPYVEGPVDRPDQVSYAPPVPELPSAEPSDPEPAPQTDRMRAEVDAEQAEPEPGPDDDREWLPGTVGVVLYTARGDTLIHVPPQNKWRSSAVRALFSLNDSLTWAMTVLDLDEAQTWADLDPDGDEVQKFFAAWGRIVGQDLGESRASRRSSTRTRGR